MEKKRYFQTYLLLVSLFILLFVPLDSASGKWVMHHRCQCNYCFTFSTAKNPACWCYTRTCKCAHCRDIVRGRTK